MAERPPPHARPGTNRTARANTIGVRRNLFQSQLTRRPTPTNSGGSSNNYTETLRLGDVEVLSDTSEIVIRDKNGEFEVDDPPTPPPDDLEEGGALDDAQESERMLHYAWPRKSHKSQLPDPQPHRAESANGKDHGHTT